MKAPAEPGALMMVQILPINTRMSKMTNTVPSNPLGAYPQFLECGQLGTAPRSRRIIMINRIIPMVDIR
jgi:hypothetical protein